MAPLEPQEKVLVSKDFLSTTHGALACESCHGGNPAGKDKSIAHAGFDPFPSANNPEKACGGCHAEAVATAKDSLHATLSTFPKVLANRANKDKWVHIDEARKNHCSACHTSCGGCHVSRPEFAQKGFVMGHVFQRRSDPINQCTACHGSRVGYEFYGERGQGDVHAAKAMDCVACHPAKEMHAAAPKDLPGRYHLKEMVQCTDCHKDLQYGSVRDHALHIGKVQCQVCHSQTYVNCYNCHVGKDAEGTAFFQNRREVETLKIGLNYDAKAPGAGYQYMLVRHVPSYPEMFDFYGKDGFTSFGGVPTWKRASPHNIQRRTWQAANCNNCHGNRVLFLATADLMDYEKQANTKVVVPDGKLPKPVKKTQKLAVDTSKVRTSMVVDAKWLHENLGQKNVVVVDARDRAAYDKGHIEGSISIDPMKSGFRTGAAAEKPFVLVDHKEVAAILGRAGLAADDHIVVYDQSGVMATMLCSVLQWAGATNLSYLDGGIEGWHAAGFHTSTEASTREERTFNGTVQPAFIVDSDALAKLLGQPNVVVLDARAIHRVLGETKNVMASRAGTIPGSVNLPLGALIMDNGALKPPAELLWMLKTRGITPDKTVITTCDTGVAASDAFFILRYLGFSDVQVHDEAWVVWSKTR
ncbi:MAG TPA: rhodanese-like domain-containing protein [Nitrospirota bacterium]|nr:rhodanese-like domain-containing protein [Nitrospirota bacterium]